MASVPPPPPSPPFSTVTEWYLWYENQMLEHYTNSECLIEEERQLSMVEERLKDTENKLKQLHKEEKALKTDLETGFYTEQQYNEMMKENNDIENSLQTQRRELLERRLKMREKISTAEWIFNASHKLMKIRERELQSVMLEFDNRNIKTIDLDTPSDAHALRKMYRITDCLPYWRINPHANVDDKQRTHVATLSPQSLPRKDEVSSSLIYHHTYVYVDHLMHASCYFGEIHELQNSICLYGVLGLISFSLSFGHRNYQILIIYFNFESLPYKKPLRKQY